METQQPIPLGYVELEDGAKPIYPMNDIFLNYTFENPENWEILRLTGNLVIEGYQSQNPETSQEQIQGKIKVRTQYQHFRSKDTRKSKDQDFKLVEEDENATYFEFQNDKRSNPPIPERSVKYFGFGISSKNNKIANQIWLLAEDVESVLNSKSLSRYVLKDEETGKNHPAISGILYVSLKKVAQEETPLGELAKFLLGNLNKPTNEKVAKIAKSFSSSFNEFKEDKEAVEMLTLFDRGKEEGIGIGKEEGIRIGVENGLEKLVEFLEKGFSLDEARDLAKNALKNN